MTQPLCAYEGCGQPKQTVDRRHNFVGTWEVSIDNHEFQPQSTVESTPVKCGLTVAAISPRMGMYIPCALDIGHKGDCVGAGNCVKHGPYLGKPHAIPQCPKWPDCIPEAVAMQLYSMIPAASTSPQGAGEQKGIAGGLMSGEMCGRSKYVPGPVDVPCCLLKGHDGFCRPDYEHKTRKPIGEHNCPSCGRWHDILKAPTKQRGCAINSQSSMQYVGMKLHSGDATLQEVLEWMVDGGSSVSLNFGEDTGLWECSWITWGERFTGVHKLVRMAVLEAINKAFARAVELGPPKESR